jgi:hypothetical protein
MRIVRFEQLAASEKTKSDNPVRTMIAREKGVYPTAIPAQFFARKLEQNKQ